MHQGGQQDGSADKGTCPGLTVCGPSLEEPRGQKENRLADMLTIHTIDTGFFLSIHFFLNHKNQEESLVDRGGCGRKVGAPPVHIHGPQYRFGSPHT